MNGERSFSDGDNSMKTVQESEKMVETESWNLISRSMDPWVSLYPEGSTFFFIEDQKVNILGLMS